MNPCFNGICLFFININTPSIKTIKKEMLSMKFALCVILENLSNIQNRETLIIEKCYH